MDHLSAWSYEHASIQTRTVLAEHIDDAFAALRAKLRVAVEQSLSSPLTRSRLHRFEWVLLILVCELGRNILQAVIQAFEPEGHGQLTKDLLFETRRVSQTR